MIKPEKHGNKWRVRYKPFNSVKRKSHTFLTKDEALYFVYQLEQQLLQCKAGLKITQLQTISNIKPRQVFTFKELCQKWIEVKVPQKRSGKDDISIINRHFIPRWENILLDDFSSFYIDKFIVDKKKENLQDKTIHNQLTLLISLFSFAYENK